MLQRTTIHILYMMAAMVFFAFLFLFIAIIG